MRKEILQSAAAGVTAIAAIIAPSPIETNATVNRLELVFTPGCTGTPGEHTITITAKDNILPPLPPNEGWFTIAVDPWKPFAPTVVRYDNGTEYPTSTLIGSIIPMNGVDQDEIRIRNGRPLGFRTAAGPRSAVKNPAAENPTLHLITIYNGIIPGSCQDNSDPYDNRVFPEGPPSIPRPPGL